MASAAPAAASAAAAPSPPSGAGSPSPGGPAPGASSPRDDGSGKPAYQSADDFFSDKPAAAPADDSQAPIDDAPPADPDAPADPESALASVIESISDPAVKAAVDKHLTDLRRQAGSAPTAMKNASANYEAAAAHAAIADAAIQRLKGAGIDTSDLEGGQPSQPRQAEPTATSDFQLESVAQDALGIFTPEWQSKILDAQDQADGWAKAAADYAAAGDAEQAAVFKKAARDQRAKIISGMMRSAVMASAKVANGVHADLTGRFTDLSGKIETGVSEATNNQIIGDAMGAAFDAIDEGTGTRKWHDAGLFTQVGDKRQFTPMGKELWPAMLDFWAKREMDPRDPDDFELGFLSALKARGKLRRAATPGAAGNPSSTTGDPTAGLAGRGTPAPAVPRRQPTSALPGESPDERAARLNRSAFAAAS